MKEKIDPFSFSFPKNNIFLLVLQILFGFLKLPLFLFLFSLSFLQFIISTIIPSGIAKNLITRMYSTTLIRVILWLFGEKSVPILPTPLCENYFENEEKPHPVAGDIIISNSISYISLFWFQVQYSPIFAVPGSKQGFVITRNLFTFFLYLIAGKPIQKGKMIPISVAIKRAKFLGVPIVLFPEGTVTNGTCLIKFSNFYSNDDLDGVNFHIFGISHRKGLVSPFITKKDKTLHLLMMLGRFQRSMKVYTVLPQDIPPFSESFPEESRELLGKILRVPLVDSYTREDKVKNE